jgi:hypothetical protein
LNAHTRAGVKELHFLRSSARNGRAGISNWEKFRLALSTVRGQDDGRMHALEPAAFLQKNRLIGGKTIMCDTSLPQMYSSAGVQPTQNCTVLLNPDIPGRYPCAEHRSLSNVQITERPHIGIDNLPR